jgi:hypothetical protein
LCRCDNNDDRGIYHQRGWVLVFPPLENRNDSHRRDNDIQQNEIYEALHLPHSSLKLEGYTAKTSHNPIILCKFYSRMIDLSLTAFNRITSLDPCTETTQYWRDVGKAIIDQ